MKQKRFDSLGRIHIPKRLRDGAGFTEDTPLKLSVDPTRGSITIERQENTCLFCKSKDHLIEIETDVFFCESCLQKIKKQAFAQKQKPTLSFPLLGKCITCPVGTNITVRSTTSFAAGKHH